jgi:hypothetical protein
LAPNWYVSPTFDSLQMLHDFLQQLNGGGGSVEQTYVYMDHQSATDWIQLCNTPSYVAVFRDSMPHSAIARRLREVVGQVGLDVIALGPGDGKSEVRLVQQIREESDRPNIRFYLFDVSQPLLSSAFKHAADTFGDDPGLFVCGIQGNFHQLPRYMQLHYTPARSHRRRVYVMLGATIGNIDNEPQFFQSAFAGAAPGDLLIFDVGLVFTDSIEPAFLKQHDPVLSRTIPDGHQRWLAGPLQRYCRHMTAVSFSVRLDTKRPLAGSYGLQVMAHVKIKSFTEFMKKPGNTKWQSRAEPYAVYLNEKQFKSIVYPDFYTEEQAEADVREVMTKALDECAELLEDRLAKPSADAKAGKTRRGRKSGAADVEKASSVGKAKPYSGLVESGNLELRTILHEILGDNPDFSTKGNDSASTDDTTKWGVVPPNGKLQLEKEVLEEFESAAPGSAWLGFVRIGGRVDI